MAERRMFAKSIVLSDAFLDMPASAKCLYYTLGMMADDDGFIGNMKSVMRQCGARSKDLDTLVSSGFVLRFTSGVVAIKHWLINNYVQGDRRKRTNYTEEYNSLTIKENRAYSTENVSKMDTERQQTVSIDKVSIDKDSIGEDNNSLSNPPSLSRPEGETRGGAAPTEREIEQFAKEESLTLDVKEFFNFYQSKGWKVGNQRMTDWKAAVRGWAERKAKETARSGTTNRLGVFGDYKQTGTDEEFDEITQKSLLEVNGRI